VIEILGEQGKHLYTASKAYFRYFDRGWREKVRSARAAGPPRSRHVVRECFFFIGDTENKSVFSKWRRDDQARSYPDGYINFGGAGANIVSSLLDFQKREKHSCLCSSCFF
jgi:hypothetical protein